MCFFSLAYSNTVSVMIQCLSDHVREEISISTTPSQQGKQWIKALDAYSGNPGGKKLNFHFTKGKVLNQPDLGVK